jgi:hypothetical protein
MNMGMGLTGPVEISLELATTDFTTKPWELLDQADVGQIRIRHTTDATLLAKRGTNYLDILFQKFNSRLIKLQSRAHQKRRVPLHMWISTPDLKHSSVFLSWP